MFYLNRAQEHFRKPFTGKTVCLQIIAFCICFGIDQMFEESGLIEVHVDDVYMLETLGHPKP